MSFADMQFTHNGDTRTVRDWCVQLNVSYNTVKSRRARGAGDSFHKLFMIKPVQVRRVEKLCAEQGENLMRGVDILELLLDESLREKVLALAKAEGVGNGYSVRNTLQQVVRDGFRYKEHKLAEREKNLEEDATQRRQRHPDGVPAQVVINDGNYMYTPSPAAFGVQPAPQITLPPPMTLEEAADIGDW